MMNDYFQYDLKNAFKEFSIPAMIMEGKWDLAYSANKANIMFEQFPNAKQAYFKDSGHIPFEDEPEAFFSSLQQFLQELEDIPQDKIKKWKSGFDLEDFKKVNIVQKPPLRRN